MVRLISVISCLLLGSCQFSESRFASHDIARGELIGTWIATEYAIKSLRDVGVKQHLKRADHVIVLRSDGSCLAKTFFKPEYAADGRNLDYRSIDGSTCSWRLGRQSGHQTLNLRAEEASGPYYYFAYEAGELVIWQFITDPDHWRYIEFSKAQPNSP